MSPREGEYPQTVAEPEARARVCVSGEERDLTCFIKHDKVRLSACDMLICRSVLCLYCMSVSVWEYHPNGTVLACDPVVVRES